MSDMNTAMRALVDASERAATRAEVLLQDKQDYATLETAAKLLDASAHAFEVVLKASQMYGGKQ